MKKILFLSANMGGGHNAAVEAVQQAVEAHYKGKYETKKIDIFSLASPTLEKVASQFYENSSKYSKMTWKSFFEITDKTDAVNKLEKYAYGFIKKQLEQIAEEKPDLIVSCYPFLSYSVAKYLRLKHHKIPIVSLITDTGEVHSSWISKGVDYYLSPTEETALYLEESGIPKEKIKMFGFPVKQWFYRTYDVDKVKKELGMPQGNQLIIYFTGLFGMGKVKSKLKAVDQQINNATILVICGKNKALFDQVKNESHNNNVRVYGYLENDQIAKFMAASDLVITKAGGISVMETVTSKKPMIITEVIPGQEEPNAEFIESMGFGYVAKTPKKLATKADFILRGDDKRIIENYKRYTINDHSDKQVADFINSLLS